MRNALFLLIVAAIVIGFALFGSDHMPPNGECIGPVASAFRFCN